MTQTNGKVDVKALAQLARINVSDDELAALEREVPEILSFVDQIQEVAAELPKEPIAPAHRNIFREDANPHESGEYTDALLANAPDTKNGYVKVKQVIKK